MKFAFLKPENLASKYSSAKQYTDSLTDPFPEFERLARNKAKDNIDPRYPRTTDGTTASIVRKTPKRIVQQLPTGKVETDDDNDWLPIVAEFIYTSKILPYANDEYDLIQKCWSIVERGLTFGSTAVYTPFLSHDGNFSPDMTLPYWGDIMVQPGKKSGYACDYTFMRSWWKEEDIDALIDRETKNSKDKDYTSTWDVKALEEIKQRQSDKDLKGQTPMERDRQPRTELIEIVTGFQTGVGATFYTFAPVTGGSSTDNGAIVLRTKKNKDPRGKMPIDWHYGDIDGSNPLGRGVIELIGGLQNLIDADMQMYQYNRALALAPPLIKRGTFSSKKIVFAPNSIIDMGSNAANTLDTLKVDTSALVNYPNLYGLQKSQLLNLVTSPDTSISSDVGNPGFSKTDAGVKSQDAVISVDDNYIRKMFEASFGNWSETAINLFFAERKGKEELQLDEKTGDKLRNLAQKGKFDEAMLSDDNKIVIDYDTATPALKFRVDASTSKMKDDNQQGQILTGLVQSLESNPVFAGLVPQDKIIAVWNKIVATSGVEDPEDLTVDLDEWKQQQQQAAQMQQQQGDPSAAEAQAPALPVKASVNYKDAPPSIQRQMEQADGWTPASEEEHAAQVLGNAADLRNQVKSAVQAPQQAQATQVPNEQPEEPETDTSDMEGSQEDVQASQLSPLDIQLIQELRQEGYPDSLIGEAMDMLNQGADPQQVMQALDGVMRGAKNG